MDGAEGGTGAQTAEARSATGQSGVDVRALLRATSLATGQLLDELDAAGLPKSVRETPTCAIPALDRALRWQTIDDFLTACEAYTLVTAPSSLTSGDVEAVRHGAEQLLLALETLLSAATPRHPTWTTNVSASMQASLLPTALGEPRVQDALQALIELFARLSAVESGEQLMRGRRLRTLLPLGGRLLMPGSVLATALALIMFLLGTIGLATGKLNTSAGGMALKGAPISSTPPADHPSAVPSGSAHSATPSSASRGTPAATTASDGAMPIDSQLSQDTYSPDPNLHDSYPGAQDDEGDPG